MLCYSCRQCLLGFPLDKRLPVLKGQRLMLVSGMILLLMETACGLITPGGFGKEPYLPSETPDGIWPEHENDMEVLRTVGLGSCVAGCQVLSPKCWEACSGNYTMGKYYWAPGPRKRFMEKPIVEVGRSGKIYFRWSDAHNASHDSSVWKNVVYGVYVMNANAINNKNWTCLYLNVSQHCALESTSFESENQPQFLVNAISRDGVIAEETFSPYFSSFVNDPSHQAFVGEVTSVRDLQVSVTQLNGTLKVCLLWRRPDEDIKHYTIHYARKTCWFDKSFPECKELSDHWAISLYMKSNTYQGTELHYCLKERSFTFNSHYWIQVDAEGVPGEPKYVITPGCRFPDLDTFTYCYSDVPKLQHPCEIFLYKPWHINSSCVGVHSDGAVDLRLDLQPPDCTSPFISYRVEMEMVSLLLDGAKDWHVTTTDTNLSYFDVTILPYSEYSFIIYASLSLPGKGDLRLVSEKFPNSTQVLWEDLRNSTTCLHYAKSDHSSQGEMSSVVIFYILAAVIAFGSVALILSLTTVLYRKYHRLPLTVDMPDIPAASNSYKSSPDMRESNLGPELLYMQDDWEINPHSVKFISELDHGAFGRVMTGLFNGVKVAIKILKDEVAPFYRKDLIHEINLMKQLGPHPNIVLLIGACTQREPTALILEYMPYGNLQSFLYKCRTEGQIVGASNQDVDEKSVVYAVIDEDGEVEQWTIAPTDLLSFARQIAKAMEFLGQRQCVHRDLAARNVLLGYNKVVKLGDFGLARAVSKPGEAYHKITHGKLPLKWMALESLRDRVFTAASDVWSFGVFLWELVTMGASPYPGITFSDLYALLACGYRMEKPSNCSDKLYELMFRCWHERPNSRPSFSSIKESLEEMLSMDANYLDLESFDTDIEDSSPGFSSSCDEGSTADARLQCVEVVLHVNENSGSDFSA